jgi:hypothetical protein
MKQRDMKKRITYAVEAFPDMLPKALNLLLTYRLLQEVDGTFGQATEDRAQRIAIRHHWKWKVVNE